MMTFKLQIRTRNGQHVLDQLKPESTINELKILLVQYTDIPVHAMKIVYGFPRKQLKSVSGLETLSAMSLRSGDTLIIEEDLNALAKVKEAEKSRVDLSPSEAKNRSQNHVSRNSGILTKRIVPADNSCLFTSIDFVIKDGKKIDLESGKFLRQLISKIVGANSDLYSEGFLGKSNAEYCSWISDNNSWGGAIEVSILAEHFQIEIDVIDSQTGRINRFGEDRKYSQRVFLIYDGVHYDPVVLENFDGTSVIQAKFNIEDEDFFAQALEIGAEAKSSRQFTNIDSGTMKCLVCNVLICGEIGLKKHLMETGHNSFGEV